MSIENELKTQIAKLEAALASQQPQKQLQNLYQISQRLNKAHTEADLLQAFLPEIKEHGVFLASIFRVDLDATHHPEWAEIIAVWQKEGDPFTPLGIKIHLPEYPFYNLWFENPDETLCIVNMTQDERVDQNTQTFYVQLGLYATAVIPLVQTGRWVGLICLSWREPHTFGAAEMAIYNALITMVAPVVENRRLVTDLEKMVEARTTDLRQYERIVATSPNFIAVVDRDYIYRLANETYLKSHGLTEEQIIGHHAIDIIGQERFEKMAKSLIDRCFAGETVSYQTWLDLSNGRRFINIIYFPYYNDDNTITGIVINAQDITAQKEMEDEQARLQQEVIEAQQRAIQELSTPIIPIMEGIIVMPLIGSIDTLRAKDITRALLKGITQYRAQVVILDITGVPIVDSVVAAHLDKTIQAAKLKGTRPIITGITEAVAESIVDLGIDWGRIETLRDLQTGLRVALEGKK